MKKVLSVMVAAAFVLTAGAALAGGPGKKPTSACPEACQKQIDDLQSSQARQDEQIRTLERAFDDYWYVRLGARAGWINQSDKKSPWRVDADSDLGWGGSIAFGREFAMYQASGRFRAEIELSKQNADFDSDAVIGQQGGVWEGHGTTDITSVFLNGYYEQPIVDGFSVYVMAGVGYAKYDLTVDRITRNGVEMPFASQFAAGVYNGSDNVFAYKLGTGITWNFTDQIATDLGYEYLGVADTDLADSINSHNIVLSFRFKF